MTINRNLEALLQIVENPNIKKSKLEELTNNLELQWDTEEAINDVKIIVEAICNKLNNNRWKSLKNTINFIKLQIIEVIVKQNSLTLDDIKIIIKNESLFTSEKIELIEKTNIKIKFEDIEEFIFDKNIDEDLIEVLLRKLENCLTLENIIEVRKNHPNNKVIIIILINKLKEELFTYNNLIWLKLEVIDYIFIEDKSKKWKLLKILKEQPDRNINEIIREFENK